MRRIKLRESDGDWHIEITEEARDQLAGLVDTTHLGSNGDLNAPVQVTFTGAAFFDGYHQPVGP